MLGLVRDLMVHKGYANAALLGAVRQIDAAAADPEILHVLEHILVANRFWLLSCLGQPFLLEEETRGPNSLDGLIVRYHRTQTQEAGWLSTAPEDDLLRELNNPLIPGGACTVSQALMQVCMHSHGHRAQCAKLLRRHGGEPPMTDFIVWLANRPEASWPLPAGGAER